MKCVNCGSVLPEGARFCPVCGAPVRGDGEAAWRDKRVYGDEVRGDKVEGDKVEGNKIIVSPEAPPDELLRAYYRSLAHECSQLPLGIIDTRFVKERGDVPLPEVYVDLEVVNPPPPEEQEGPRDWSKRLWRGEGRERRPLLEAFVRSRRAVLLGEAGSGKSTFVNYLAYLLAAQDGKGAPKELRGLLVVRLALRQAAADCIPAGAPCGEAQMLWQALRADLEARLGKDAAGKLALHLNKRLLEQGGVILLDGLDEVPEADLRRAALLEAIEKFSTLLPEDKALTLVTARPYAYAERKWHLEGFETLSLAAFSDKQVGRFIERWYKAVRAGMGWSEAEAGMRGGRLRTALQERPYLADLACRPLLLTLMATLHSSWGQLPDDRADLYEETVKLLLSRWQRARQSVGPDGQLVVEASILQALDVGEERLRQALEELAYNAHQRQGQSQGRDEAPADISRADVLLAFEPLLGKVKTDTLLSYLGERAGLLAARRQGVYAFPHRSFQEYLAACCLAGEPEFAERLYALVCDDPAWWREVCLLGVGKARQGGLGQAASVVGALIPDYPPNAARERQAIEANQWRAAALAGQALVELRLADKGGDKPLYRALLKRARAWLVALLEGGFLAARERAEGGDILAALGDLRFRADLWRLPGEARLGFVEIPAGRFRMGSDKQRDKDAWDDEQPQHEVDLPAYYIARYPTTTAQFRAFVEDSGYEPGDKDCLRGVDNHPVAWVSWDDAMAYCEWLTEKLAAYSRWLIADSREVIEDSQWPIADRVERIADSQERGFWEGLASGKWRVNLPSEAEWEKAARGVDGRIYSWGDEFDPDKANTTGTGLGATSAVGCFPNGASPYGLLDMSGNVWEWTRSLFKDYPYHPDDGREDPGSRDRRVLRGGAFDDDPRLVRCAYRYGNLPDNHNDSNGFRVRRPHLALESETLDSETLTLKK